MAPQGRQPSRSRSSHSGSGSGSGSLGGSPLDEQLGWQDAFGTEDRAADLDLGLGLESAGLDSMLGQFAGGLDDEFGDLGAGMDGVLDAAGLLGNPLPGDDLPVDAFTTFGPAPAASPATVVDLDALLRTFGGPQAPNPAWAARPHRTASVATTSSSRLMQVDDEGNPMPDDSDSGTANAGSLVSPGTGSPRFVFTNPFHLPSPPPMTLPDPGVPDDLSSLLLRLTISSEPTAILPIVHRPSFVPGTKPPWLLWAMMAAACRFFPELDSIPGAAGGPGKGWGERIYLAASTALASSLPGSAPSLESVQALMFLVMACVTHPSPARIMEAWRWLSLAVGMARELGLSREPPASMPWVERESRRRAWFFLWGFDKLLACNSGMPPMIPKGEGAALRMFSPAAAWESPEPPADEADLNPHVTIDFIDPPPSLEDLAHHGARLQYLDTLMYACASFSHRMAAKRRPEYGPGSAAAARKRAKVEAAMQLWAEAERRYNIDPAATDAAEAEGRVVWEVGEHRWLGWYLGSVFLHSPRSAVELLAKDPTDAGALEQVAAWAADGEAVAACAASCRAAAGWLDQLVRLDAEGVEAGRYDRRLKFVGYVGGQVAYMGTVWCLLRGAAPPDAARDGGGIMGGPRVPDAEIPGTLVRALRGMAKVWKVCDDYADGLESVIKVIDAMGM
ncbi:fungal-specific transcription factor domain-containing protein [Hyaloraphidium curvatum]|nr:fungal-specific transcription factor domain-containing protein [Hyaloraphidium curvatum]